jgi:hypothetical protein
MLLSGAPMKPSSLKLQFSPDATIGVAGGGGGAEDGPVVVVDVLDDEPPHPTTAIAATRATMARAHI